MFPLWDDQPTRRFPFITITIIIMNVLVFIYQVSLGEGFNQFIYSMGLIPFEISHFIDLYPPGPSPIYLTIFYSMFMHGSLIHLIGNMLFLWIFGNNIEDFFGRIPFILFYLLCGVAAAFTQILFNPNSTIPMVGASGAIAGVLGGYLILYPRARVTTVIIFGFFIRLVRIPALIFLGLWIIYQFLYGISSLSVSSAEGGVAWFAHIGGYIAGLISVKVYKILR
ncbi:MAG: rhomboid family intramembrane serine protease [Candidatus Caldatribacteriota bacterium]